MAFGWTGPEAQAVTLMRIRVLKESDREWAAAVVAQNFGSPEVISRGVRHESRSLPGLIAECEGERIGLLQYRIAAGHCEVVVVVALRRRQGTGRRMLAKMGVLARARSCLCLRLVTTNDNRSAQQFYEALGWKLVAVHRGAVAAARRLKPEIPTHAFDGTPIEDEFEYEFSLARADPDGASSGSRPTRSKTQPRAFAAGSRRQPLR